MEREKLKTILCRHCDGISGGEPCDIKDTCTVLRDAPVQIMSLFQSAQAEAVKAERERIKSLLLDKDWGTMCADNDQACPSCKRFWQALSGEGELYAGFEIQGLE